MSNNLFRAAVLLIVAFLAAGCSKTHDAGKPEGAPAVVVKGTSLEVVKLVATTDVLDVVGSVRARTSSVVSPRIPGSINVLRVREGDRVRKGQLLAQLDAQENQASAAVATAAIDEARRGLDEAHSRKKLADMTFDRYEKLYSEQAISRQEFDVRQTEKDMAAQGVARAASRLKQAQEGARAASTMADYTKIIAPISGVVVSKQADLGASVFPGQPLMTIENDGSYQLELALPENMAAMVKPGSPLRVTLDSVGAPFTAKIGDIVPAADPGSRTFIAKIALSQKGLKSGMFGRGSISLGTTTNGITVPKQAVVNRGAMTSVWTVDKENIVHMRIVRVGRESGARIEVLSGLSEGDRVVVAGVDKVVEGARVE
ncbi:MAG: efflux RND transporter periplasmic adaptor subunit [Desulfuromonadaceae bacterium]|nr:efflux RND transporter periplasmic adaptor subunit [Desulfuromonadaceae bacterium]MDD2848723.1 efflux RND transporter periplasmic adaptor subunit [Desulfuromonadaceae bacterium]MDD4130373.1 efflux RND transporter periplasmic adaptor subunit [Desulfuromonadaceae bacterium]